jgi:L-fuconolactonase
VSALRVDAHQHIFEPSLHTYPWTGDGGVLDATYDAAALRPLLAGSGIDRTVLVQALPSEAETQRLLEIAAGEPFVGAVVGWIDLCAPDVAARIPPGLRGVRHQVADEQDPRWLARDDVQRGIAAVGVAGLVYELLVRPAQLPLALDTARAHPDMQFVLGHMGLPPLDGDDSEWRDGVRALAAQPNVSCKLCGVLTLGGSRWRLVDVAGLLDPLVDWFTPQRLMFGSDWPACRLGGEYDDAVQVVEEGLQALTEDEQADIMGATAARIYRLT